MVKIKLTEVLVSWLVKMLTLLPQLKRLLETQSWVQQFLEPEKKKSKLNETEKKESKGKNEKDKLLVLLFQEKLLAQLLPNQKSLLLAKVARVLHKFKQASHC